MFPKKESFQKVDFDYTVVEHHRQLQMEKIAIVVVWEKNIASRYDNIAQKISPRDTITIYRTSLVNT